MPVVPSLAFLRAFGVGADEGGRSARSFDLGFRGLAEAVRGDVELLREVALAEYLHGLAEVLENARGDERIGIDGGAGIEALEARPG